MDQPTSYNLMTGQGGKGYEQYQTANQSNAVYRTHLGTKQPVIEKDNATGGHGFGEILVVDIQHLAGPLVLELIIGGDKNLSSCRQRHKDAILAP